MALYLEQGEIAPDELHAPFEKALREGHLVPVCFISAQTGAGVAELLDVLVKLAPNPTEGNPPLFYKGEGDAAEEFRSEPDPKKHVLAHVFKVVIDPFVGKLGVFRVHQGTVTKDTQLFIGDGRKPFKVGHLFMLQGGKNVEVDRAVPGRHRRGGEGRRDRVRLRAARLARRGPHPHAAARVPDADVGRRDHAEEARRRAADLRGAAPDDRRGSRRSSSSTTRRTNETVLRALGDLHLRSVLERMTSQFKLEVDTQPPRIPYRETITAQGRGPPPPQEADRRRRAVRRGVPARRAARARRGLRVRRRDQGRRDSAPVHAGRAEGRRAGARSRARSPASRCRTCASSSTTASTTRWTRRKSRSSPPARRRSSTRSRRRGRSCSSRSSTSRSSAPRRTSATSPATCRRGAGRSPARGVCSPGVLAISGLAPLAELDGYSARLKSVTGGHGSWSMQLSHYEQAPPNLQQQLVADTRSRASTKRK